MDVAGCDVSGEGKKIHGQTVFIIFLDGKTIENQFKE